MCIVRLKSLCLILLLLMAVSENIVLAAEAVKRPPHTMSIEERPLQKEVPQELGAQWWEVIYTDGRIQRLALPPTQVTGIQTTRLCINDLEILKVMDMGLDVQVVRVKPNISTFVYPAFWTGQSWVLEHNLPQAAPEVYRRLMAKATLEHRAVIGMNRWKQARLLRVKKTYQMHLHQLSLQQSDLSAQEREYLEKRLANERRLLEQALPDTSTPSDAVPRTLVSAYRFERSIVAAQQEQLSIRQAIARTQQKIKDAQGTERLRLTINQHQMKAEIDVFQEYIKKMQDLKAEYQQKQWLLFY